jgi:carbon monoxide dehydrogenase subunit G
MDLSGTYTFQAERESVWNLMMNPDAIAKALPGVEEFVPIEGETNAWNARLKVSLAAVNGIGQRVIKAAANMMSNRFFSNLAQQLSTEENQ